MSHHNHGSNNHNFTLDHASGRGNGSNFQGQASGTFHGNPDVHVGGNVSHNSGGWQGGVSGGVTAHPTPNTSVGVQGSYQSNGAWSAGVGGSISF